MEERIRFVGDPALDDWEASSPAVVQITLRDGRRLTKRVDWPKGMPENPMTPEELEGKFLDLAEMRMPRERAERLCDLVNALERVDDVGQLAELLAVEQGA
jgi:2-methylcitrate dehydratase PrpD